MNLIIQRILMLGYTPTPEQAKELEQSVPEEISRKGNDWR